MLDPFNILGVTSNVINLLEFVWKLLAETEDIYTSAAGEHAEYRTISTIAEDVSRLENVIAASIVDDEGLNSLVKESQEVARDLLEALDRLKIRGENTIWKSFMLALKHVWKDKKIQVFSHRLAKLQGQVASHCQMLILSGVSDISRKLADLEGMNKLLKTDMRTEIRKLRADVISAAERLNPEDSTEDLAALKKRLRVRADTDALDKELINDISSNLRDFSGKVTHLFEVSKTTEDLHKVLSTLRFDSIRSRENKIPEAHATTFAWIFQKVRSNQPQSIRFVDWLENGIGIYWIQGKAGSGKSTLMKFLSDHEETQRYLRTWAGNQALVVAKFFFWHAGSPLQKSREGLLRSLLFETLRHCPNLIPRVSAIRGNLRDGYDDEYSWTPDELLSVCCSILEDTTDTRFCFFIDGLDEYEEGYLAPSDLIHTIKILGSFSNIKLCVSSRPWSAFADAFGQHPESLLKLEDLTHDDIRCYVMDKFHGSQAFVNIKETNLPYLDLVNEVCQKAQGVFLWVYLVVRDLLDGLTNGDSVDFLRNRLERFPEDLEQFFQHMIKTIPSTYFGYSARAFDVARSAAEPQSAVAFSFMDEAEERPQSIFELPLEPMLQPEFQFRMSQVRRRLDARCKGLLEVADEGGDDSCYNRLKVDFLHRTVRDFLFRSDGLGIFMKENLNSPSTALLMCRAITATIKRAPPHTLEHSMGFSTRLFNCLLNWASQCEQHSGDLTELLKVLSSAESVYHWHGTGGSFLGLACQNGAVCYVKSKLADKQVRLNINGPDRPLLDHALQYISRAHPGIVKFLLENGAKPNQKYNRSTIWTRFISQLPYENGVSERENIHDIVQILIIYGADLEASTSIACSSDRLGSMKILPRTNRWDGTRAHENESDESGIGYDLKHAPCLYGEDSWIRFSERDHIEKATVRQVIEACFPEEEAIALLHKSRVLSWKERRGGLLKPFLYGKPSFV